LYRNQRLDSAIVQLTRHPCPLDRSCPGTQTTQEIHAVKRRTYLPHYGLREAQLRFHVAPHLRIQHHHSTSPLLPEVEGQAHERLGLFVGKGFRGRLSTHPVALFIERRIADSIFSSRPVKSCRRRQEQVLL